MPGITCLCLAVLRAAAEAHGLVRGRAVDGLAHVGIARHVVGRWLLALEKDSHERDQEQHRAGLVLAAGIRCLVPIQMQLLKL